MFNKIRQFDRPLHDLHVIHTVASLLKSSGGPTRTVTSLCCELGRMGVQVDLVSQDLANSQNSENLLPPAIWVRTSLAPVTTPFQQIRHIWPNRFRDTLLRCCEGRVPYLIHDHGLWLSTNHVVAVTARKLSIPLLVSTRGMLEPWAINHRAWKKRLAWYLYQLRDLREASVLCATAEKEVESLRRLGLKQPIAMIPNGVNFSVVSKEKTVKSPRVALFVGRIHPVKGLLELVDAWRIARPRGWRVIIAGPDEGGHRAVVEERIRAANLLADFEFVGPVDDQEKAALYRRAELFVLPSFTENFGVVVAEALAFGVPVITTRGTPWDALGTYSCGWWIDIGVEPLIAALREATMLDDEARRIMGKRGKAYVKRFNWADIARQMTEVYRWVLDGGPAPDCVRLV